jgi:hypothetical protein
MKKIFLIFIFLLPIISCAQSYDSLVDTNKTWSNLHQTAGGPPPSILSTNIVKFQGDTIIVTKHYLKVFATSDSMQLNYNLIGFIREDISKKVFFRTLQDTTNYLLYDFNVGIGDTINIGFSQALVVDTIDTIYVFDSYKKRFVLSYFGIIGEVWIEGIGSLCGVLASGSAFIVGGKYDLLCYSENDTLKYSNPFYSECYYNNVGVIEIESNQWKLFPNPFIESTTIEFENNNSENYTLEIYNNLGQKVRTISNIRSNKIIIERGNFNSGIYFFQLKNNSGIKQTGKLVVE